MNVVRPLYITYDGLLDPLGTSQILPYLRQIARQQGGAWVLSFEKPEKLAAGEQAMRVSLAADGIQWHPLLFSSGGLVNKVKDLLRMYGWAWRLVQREGLDVVHARGHPSAQVGLFLRRWLGRPLIFDCRGLWVDERVDKGGWDLSKPFHRLQYRHFKRIERRLFAQADRVVVLTRQVLPEAVRLGANASKVTVIPCCADFSHFKLADAAQRQQTRERLGVPANARVMGYLGSVGSVYQMDRHFRLLTLAMAHDPQVWAVAITPDQALYQAWMHKHLPAEFHARVVVVTARREEVPAMLAALDVLINFYTATYSRIGTSPTRLAECFATGVPAICNPGVGDVAEDVAALQAGRVLDPQSDAELREAAEQLPEICAQGGARLRASAIKMFGLDVAHARYQDIYESLKRETC